MGEVGGFMGGVESGMAEWTVRMDSPSDLAPNALFRISTSVLWRNLEEEWGD